MLLLDVSISFVDGAVTRRILLGTYDVTVEKCCSRQCMMTAMATRLIGGNEGSRAISYDFSDAHESTALCMTPVSVVSVTVL